MCARRARKPAALVADGSGLWMSRGPRLLRGDKSKCPQYERETDDRGERIGYEGGGVHDVGIETIV